MNPVKCLFISPETERVGELHRRFSVKELADMLVVNKGLSDLYVSYMHMTDFPAVHKFIEGAHFTSKKATMGCDLSLNIESIINVPVKMLMSPLQVMTSKAYHAKREDSYILSLGPVILPFDVTEDEALSGWVSQEQSTDI